MSSGWYILVKGGKTKLYNTKTEKPLYFKNEKKENIDYGFILSAEAYTNERCIKRLCDMCTDSVSEFTQAEHLTKMRRTMQYQKEKSGND